MKSDFYDDFGDNLTDGGKKYMFEFFTNKTNKFKADKATKITRVQRRVLTGEENAIWSEIVKIGRTH